RPVQSTPLRRAFHGPRPGAPPAHSVVPAQVGRKRHCGRDRRAAPEGHGPLRRYRHDHRARQGQVLLQGVGTRREAGHAGTRRERPLSETVGDTKETAPAFHVGFEGVVKPEWIDINEHMNVRWYDHVFDNAEHDLIEAIGISDPYIAASGFTIYRLEKRIRYERELLLGEQLLVKSRITFTDERILKHRHELLNLSRNIRAA